jgi:hypothetical protein
MHQAATLPVTSPAEQRKQHRQAANRVAIESQLLAMFEASCTAAVDAEQQPWEEQVSKSVKMVMDLATTYMHLAGLTSPTPKLLHKLPASLFNGCKDIAEMSVSFQQ